MAGASLGMGRGKPLSVRAALGGPTSGGQVNVLRNKHEKNPGDALPVVVVLQDCAGNLAL
ncbi:MULTISPECIES: hypothetical protein [Acetobacter]|uniref:hypothetical protein n=1 Tax=Acetobacter TaxID=434 RepID=UPI00376FFC0B